MSTKRYTLLCNGKLWGEFENPGTWVNALPDNAFIYLRDGVDGASKWLNKALERVPTADLPPDIKTLALLLGLT